MLQIKTKGKLKKTTKLLDSCSKDFTEQYFVTYAEEMVRSLKENTPEETGKTADSWSYKIVKKENGHRIEIYNSNVVDGCCIAVILQYGHATRNGGWVEGIDYINPALKPIINKLKEDSWKEVTNK